MIRTAVRPIVAPNLGAKRPRSSDLPVRLQRAAFKVFRERHRREIQDLQLQVASLNETARDIGKSHCAGITPYAQGVGVRVQAEGDIRARAGSERAADR